MMPEEKVVDLAAFRLIQGSKVPEPVFEAPSTPAGEPLEVLTNAAEAAGDYAQVLVIYKDHDGGFDFWYSTTTDAEKLMLIERAKSWLMSDSE